MHDRHFTVAVFVVEGRRTVLMRHPLLNRWLPPGGHIGSGETPDEAALREVREETGLDVCLIGDTGPDDGVTPLVRPLGLQLEPISDGHEHIDLVYVARVKPHTRADLRPEHGTSGLDWYTPEEARALGACEEVLWWIGRALEEAARHSLASG